MPSSRLRWLASAAVCAALSLAAVPAENDLDAFMRQVVARRDENWKKLQQYVLDEHETADLLGPGRTRLYGLVRDYTWYIRDGVFVRSPVRYDGVTLDEAERLKYEKDWIERERHRDEKHDEKKDALAQPAPAAAATPDPDALVKLAREPQFVSSAYFLRFHFEPGHYAFAGRETFDGQQVYKIEYYPERLFNDDHEPGDGGDAGTHQAPRQQSDEDARFERQMNKVALVTLWVVPDTFQIVQYAFDNIGFDFLPGRALVRIDTIRATMRMTQAFAGVWLPARIEGRGVLSLATGSYEVHYATQYVNYREAAVKVRIR